MDWLDWQTLVIILIIMMVGFIMVQWRSKNRSPTDQLIVEFGTYMTIFLGGIFVILLAWASYQYRC